MRTLQESPVESCINCIQFKRATQLSSNITPRHGRCQLHNMWSSTKDGVEIPSTKRPAARFDTDVCEDFREHKDVQKLNLLSAQLES